MLFSGNHFLKESFMFQMGGGCFSDGGLTFKWGVCPMWGASVLMGESLKKIVGWWWWWWGTSMSPSPPPIMRNPAMTLIWPYCDQSQSGHNFPHLKIVQRRICIIFINHSMADIWQNWDYAGNPECNRVLSMALVLNMPGFCIYQGS